VHIRAGMARTVLVVGAEVHSGFMPWQAASWARLAQSNGSSTDPNLDAPIPPGEWDLNTRTRHLSVLFGDGAAAVVVQAHEGTDRGVIDSLLKADGQAADKLCVPGVGFGRRPYVDAGQIERGEIFPSMDGPFVFKMATTKMVEVAEAVLNRNGVSIGDVTVVLMHQANKRINEFAQRSLGLPDEKVVHNIHKYANTTSATIPLLWDECAREGRIREGDLVLLVGFGAGMTWGAALVRA